ncbi:hypothetical protein NE237_018187 [Protea cynaroides]|uniref:Uncharacterized protein n=1 Tax=Protea cynaroides TaxID=273540 RepID=A0A9Q0K9E4_9MAGN|nr:hypothetical protein NE237_018187 [Protea cynaroides]
MEPGSSSGASSEGPPPNPVVEVWSFSCFDVTPPIDVLEIPTEEDPSMDVTPSLTLVGKATPVKMNNVDGGGAVSPTASFPGKLHSYPSLDIFTPTTNLLPRGDAPTTSILPSLDVSRSSHSIPSGSTLGSVMGSATLSPIQFSITQQALIYEYISHHPTLASAILSIAPQLSFISLTCPFPSPLPSSLSLETQPVPLSVAMPLQVIIASSSHSKRP